MFIFGPHDPEVMGVIANSERRDDVTIVTFQDGTTLDVDFSETDGLDGSSVAWNRARCGYPTQPAIGT